MIIFTEEQTQALEKFKDRMAKHETDDWVLKRFLKARGFDLAKAEDMLLNSIQWRKDVDIKSTLTYDFSKVIRDNIWYRVAGYDDEGSVVVYSPFGLIDIRTCVEQGYSDEVIIYVYHCLETLSNLIQESNHDLSVVIIDLRKANYGRLTHISTLQTLYRGFQALERNYPEVVKRMLFINAPGIFNFVYNFIKPVLTGETADKISIINSDKKNWVPLIKKYIRNKNDIPIELEESLKEAKEWHNY